MSACVDDVACWMAANWLQLNHAKSEVLRWSSTRRPHQIPGRAVRIGSTTVQPVSAVRDLEITLDAEVTMSKHVSAVVTASYAELQRIRSVRHSVPRRALLTVIQAHHHHHHVACPELDVAVRTSLLHACRFCARW